MLQPSKHVLHTNSEAAALAYMVCKSRIKKSQTSAIKGLGVAYEDVQLYYYLSLP